MKRKLVSIMLILTLVMSAIFTGCGKTDGKDTSDADKASVTKGAEETEDTTETEASRTPLTLEVYDDAANYQGTATGWFANYVKNKFNLELNIIAPNASGDAASLYQTRCSSGKLGDLILIPNANYIDCVKAGLIKDITGLIEDYPNISVFSEQIKTFAKQVEGSEDKIYGIPTEMTNTSASTYSQTSVISSPYLPWDFYKELGAPEMKNLNDLLNVLEAIQKAHPTNVDGDKAYALSLWSDWDDYSMENVNQMTKWYGEEVNGSILLNAKGEMKSLMEDSGAYHKMLKFLYEANQRGLIDPDSATQDWNSTLAKIKAKRCYMLWYNWSTNFINTIDRTSKGDGFMFAPVADMSFYQSGDSYYGSGRMWCIGSQVDEATTARIMEFLDWYASPESVELQNVQIKDFTYEVNDDGTYTLINKDAVVKNPDVPEEWGGGPILDGMNQLNQWIVGASSINSRTGESYSSVGWKSEKEAEMTQLKKEWFENYGVKTSIELMQNNGQLAIVPSTNLVLAQDTTDIALIRSQCSALIKNSSWTLVYASDEASFEEGWKQLKEKLSGLGWDELVQFDKDKYQVIVDARNAVTK